MNRIESSYSDKSGKYIAFHPHTIVLGEFVLKMSSVGRCGIQQHGVWVFVVCFRGHDMYSVYGMLMQSVLT